MTKVNVGDKVRSYDFEGNESCYIEGIVTEIVTIHGLQRYKIYTTKLVWNGEEETKFEQFYYPVINGTEGLFGTTDGVKKIA